MNATNTGGTEGQSRKSTMIVAANIDKMSVTTNSANHLIT